MKLKIHKAMEKEMMSSSGSNTFKLMLVDDHELFLDGVKSLLEGQDQLKVVGTASNGKEALRFLESNAVDLMLCDLNMPEMGGIELVKKLKTQYSDIKIIVLTMHNDRPTISEILMAEAEGYVLKNTDRKELHKAIYRVMDGGTFYSNEVMEIILEKYKEEHRPHSPQVDLTNREKEILQLIAQEKSSEEIADTLYISKRTVETHRKNIIKKTKAKSIVGLLKLSYQMGLIVW